MVRLLLCDPDGNVEHEYLADRMWGRIYWNGNWYRSQHKRGRPDAYMRD